MAAQNLYKQSYVNKLRKKVEQKLSLADYKEDVCPFKIEEVKKIIGIDKQDDLLAKLMVDPQDDFKNAIYIYEAFEKLTPLQASDERLWVYLAHTELYRYVRTRWRLEDIILKRKPDGTMPLMEDAQRDFILEYWFGSYNRQSLSGLWWSIFETVDTERDNPYELSEFLFSHADFRTRRFTSSVFARNKEGMIGLLDSMRQLDTYKEYFEVRANFAIMYFNYLGGTRQLSALNRDFFEEEMRRIDVEVRKYQTRNDIKANKNHLFDNL